MKTDRGHKHLDTSKSYNMTMQKENVVKHPKHIINRVQMIRFILCTEMYLYIGCCKSFWLHYLLWFNKICSITLRISASSPHPSTFSKQAEPQEPGNKSRFDNTLYECDGGNWWSILFWSLIILTYPPSAPSCNQSHIYLFWPNFSVNILKTYNLVKLQQFKLTYGIAQNYRTGH